MMMLVHDGWCWVDPRDLKQKLWLLRWHSTKLLLETCCLGCRNSVNFWVGLGQVGFIGIHHYQTIISNYEHPSSYSHKWWLIMVDNVDIRWPVTIIKHNYSTQAKRGRSWGKWWRGPKCSPWFWASKRTVCNEKMQWSTQPNVVDEDGW